MAQSRFKTDAHAALFRTAKTTIACAKFGKDEYVGIRFYCTNGNGTRYFAIHSTQDGRKFSEHEEVCYPEHHLTSFCL